MDDKKTTTTVYTILNTLSTFTAPAAIAAITATSLAPPHAICTHIYPLQVAVGLRRGHHSIIGVDDGHDVHTQQLLQRAVKVLPLVVIMEIQICHQDLTAHEGGESRKLRQSQTNHQKKCWYCTFLQTTDIWKLMTYDNVVVKV